MSLSLRVGRKCGAGLVATGDRASVTTWLYSPDAVMQTEHYLREHGYVAGSAAHP